MYKVVQQPETLKPGQACLMFQRDDSKSEPCGYEFWLNLVLGPKRHNEQLIYPLTTFKHNDLSTLKVAIAEAEQYVEKLGLELMLEDPLTAKEKMVAVWNLFLVAPSIYAYDVMLTVFKDHSEIGLEDIDMGDFVAHEQTNLFTLHGIYNQLKSTF